MADKYAILKRTVNTYDNECRIVPEYYDSLDEASAAMRELLEDKLREWREWYERNKLDPDGIIVSRHETMAYLRDDGNLVEWSVHVLHPSRREAETA